MNTRFKFIGTMLALALSCACQTNTQTTNELVFPLGISQWDKSQDYNYESPSNDCSGCPDLTVTSPSSLGANGWRYELAPGATTFNVQGLITDMGAANCGTNNDLFCSHEWRIWPADTPETIATLAVPGGPISSTGVIDLNPSFYCGTSRLVLVSENTYGLTRAIIEVVRSGGVCDATTSGPTLNVRLNWGDIDTDLDLHLVRDGGTFADEANDCYYATCKSSNSMGTSSLDWGVAGWDADNPLLDVDDATGGGPENILLADPADGTYTVMVHYYQGTALTLPEIEVWVDNELKSWVLYGAELSSFSQDTIWIPLTIYVENGMVSVSESQRLDTWQ